MNMIKSIIDFNEKKDSSSGCMMKRNTDILRWLLLMGLSARIIWKYKRKADN